MGNATDTGFDLSLAGIGALWDLFIELLRLRKDILIIVRTGRHKFKSYNTYKIPTTHNINTKYPHTSVTSKSLYVLTQVQGLYLFVLPPSGWPFDQGRNRG